MKHKIFSFLAVLALLAGLFASPFGATTPAQAAGVVKIYVTNTGNNTISQSNLDGTGGVGLGNLNGTVAYPYAIALDVANNHMYVVNSSSNTIGRSNLDGTSGVSLGNLNGTLNFPISIALDVPNNKMYVVSANTTTIVRANLDGTGGVSLGDLNGTLSCPRGIGLDVANNKMYVVSQCNGSVVRANLDGTGGVSLGNLGGTLNAPEGIALDLTNNKMYIANNNSQTISQANLDGTGGTSLGNLNGSLNYPRGIALDITNNKMYVTNIGNATISRANLDGTGGVSLGNLNGTLSNPLGIALDLPVCSSAITVTNNADSGAGSLRQAVADVCAGGTITFDVSLNGTPISLDSTLTISQNLTIQGNGVGNTIIQPSSSNIRHFYLTAGDLTLDGMTLQNGSCMGGCAYPSGSYGGSVLNWNSGSTLTILNSFFTNNHTNSNAAAVLSQGPLVVRNSTFSNNVADYPGAGGAILASSNLDISNSTFSGNSGGYLAGTIIVSGPVSITNSTIANNSGAVAIYSTNPSFTLTNNIIANNSGGDCSSTTSVVGNNNLIKNGSSACGLTNGVNGNIIGVDPLLNTLGNNGGPTQTMSLQTGSPAINAGDNAFCPLNDQTGYARLNGDGGYGGDFCDIGAYEVWDNVAPLASIDTFPSNPSATSSAAFTFSATDDFTIDPYFYFWCKLDGGTWETCDAGTASYSGLANGSHTFYFDAYDEVGNVNSTSYTWTVAVAPAPLPSPWIGSVSITSDKNVVAVGRPHVGAEVASYDGVSSGALNAFIPMLFKDAYGGSYDSAFYIENMGASTANIDIYYFDSAGNLSCHAVDTITALASKGYWVPGQACLPAGWVGGVTVASDQPIIAIGRPHINGEVMTYNGFASGSLRSYLPMLFKNAFGGGSYDSAFYIQNVDVVNTGNITIEFYDSTGALSCTITDTILPLASKGYWVPGQTCLPDGWTGGVVAYSDTDIVTVGRPHIGTQITTYTGVASGGLTSYVPMLFKGAFGGTYNSAVYVQNNDATTTANLTFDFYDSAGTLICTGTGTLAPWAVTGYWIPGTACLPDGWAGGVVITSNVEIVAVGRPHIGSQVTTYNGFTSGSLTSYLPMLFKDAFGGSYDSAFYIQNTEASPAAVTIDFYDSAGVLTCSRNDTIAAHATQGLWVPSLSCIP